MLTGVLGIQLRRGNHLSYVGVVMHSPAWVRHGSNEANSGQQ